MTCSRVPPRGIGLRSFLVHTDSLPAEGRVFPLTFGPEEVNGYFAEIGALDARVVGGVEGEARVLPSGRDLFVLGTVTARVRYDCVRCLEAFERDVRAEFHRVYTPAAGEGAQEMELSKADLEVEPLDGEAIDLARTAVEELLLALEPHPVCREQCAGLCPACGANRNERECGCAAAGTDPRLTALGAWRKPEKS